MKPGLTVWMAVAVVLVSGCAGSRAKKEPNDGAYIDYQLPVTAMQLTLDATLIECGANPVAKGTVTLTPVAKASPHAEHRFRVSGENLASFSKKREVKIDVYPHGAIKTINSSVSDRTAAIIAGVVKLAGSVLFADDQKVVAVPGVCSSAAEKSLDKFRSLESKIARLQERLLDDKEDQAQLQKKIDVLAVEAARVKQDYLSLKLVRVLDFADETRGGVIQWKAGELGKWLQHQKGEENLVRANFAVGWCVVPVGGGDPLCNPGLAKGFSRQAVQATAAPVACRADGGDCRTTLVFRDPARAVLTAVVMDKDLVTQRPDGKMAEAVFPMAQWGVMSYLPLSVGFGGSKSLSLAMDEFGSRTSFGWNSNARGEEIIGAAQGVVDSVSTFDSLRAGQDLRSNEAQIKVLETQQKLNKLNKCKAIIEAGGFVCPDQ